MSEENKITIKVPEGYEAKWNSEHTEVEIVKKEEAALTYKDICEILFINKKPYYTNSYGLINNEDMGGNNNTCRLNNAASVFQLKKMLAYNKLMNIATYLNGEWKPDWDNTQEDKYYIFFGNVNHKYLVSSTTYDSGLVYFKSQELAKQAMKIMGEDLDTLFKN